jgi:hypothetical protein
MMRRFWSWLNARLNIVASEEESRYYDFWDRVEDHRPVCSCPLRETKGAHCERHTAINVRDTLVCAHHGHTYDYAQP